MVASERTRRSADADRRLASSVADLHAGDAPADAIDPHALPRPVAIGSWRIDGAGVIGARAVIVIRRRGRAADDRAGGEAADHSGRDRAAATIVIPMAVPRGRGRRG